MTGGTNPSAIGREMGRMPTEWKWVVCVAWLAAAPVTASAQEQTCTYGGQQYAEGVTICQSGLRQSRGHMSYDLRQ